MFSSVPMSQMRIVVLDRDKRNVLQGLGRLGAMHLSHEPAGPDSAPLAPVDCGAERARCESILLRLSGLRNALELKPSDGELPSAAPGAEAMPLDQIETALTEYETSLSALNERRQTIQAKRDQLATVVEQLVWYREVDLPLGELGQSSFLHFSLGSLPETQLQPLRDKVADNVVLLPLPRGKGRPGLVAVTSRVGRFAMETALQQAGFQREELPAKDTAAVAGLLDASRREQAGLDVELKQVQLARVGLAATAEPRLKAMEQCVILELRLLEAEESLPRTRLTVLITGWVPDSEAAAVARKIQDLSRGCCVVETNSADQLPADQVPVLLRHSCLLRPFELLVAGYGLPGYRDIEPTLFVAITYMLMFGMMFGDIGHGAVLMLGGLGTILKGKSRKVRDVGTLLLLAGFSSLIFGGIYGSCFGLASLHKYALWHDPLDGNPIGLMAAAIGMGVCVISIGVILNIVNRFRKHDWVGGFLDSFGVVGAIFYWGVLGLLLKYAALQERGLVGLVVVLVIVLPLLAWALRAPLKHALDRRAHRHSESEGYLDAAMESIVEAFEAVLSYMANTISFVRLAAYAMSHAAVLMATFVMAREVEKMSVGGGFFSVLVIIGGNLVAITLEGVIAAVQALRLEYYEFFNKFFSGRGQAFIPFRLG
jgi:V/A-type H+-transporting ATPase subunit I